MSMKHVPGYPFYPCRICISEGYSGKNNDGCDHTAFERARASGINIHAPNMDSGEAGRAALKEMGE